MRTCRIKLLVQKFLKSALLVVKYIERKVSRAIFSALLVMKSIERKVFLALLLGKDIEGKFKEVMIKENDMVMKFVSRPQGPLRQDLGRAGSADQGQRHRSVDLLGDVFRGPHGDVQSGVRATPHRGQGGQANRSCPENFQRGGSHQKQDHDLRGLSADRQRQDQSRPAGEDRHPSQGRSRLAGAGRSRIPGHSKNETPVDLLGYSKNENQAETKRIQSKDRNGPTLEQDLSSLLVQQLIQENEELKKKDATAEPISTSSTRSASSTGSR